MSVIEEYMAAARVKVPYSLIEGETILLDDSSYPFGEGRLPIMCKSLGEEIGYERAYVSGGRSIVLPSDNGWFKAKGIGSYDLVPPRYYKGRVLSYYLERDVIGSGSLVWGFLTESEAQHELEWMEELGIVSHPHLTGQRSVYTFGAKLGLSSAIRQPAIPWRELQGGKEWPSG